MPNITYQWAELSLIARVEIGDMVDPNRLRYHQITFQASFNDNFYLVSVELVFRAGDCIQQFTWKWDIEQECMVTRRHSEVGF